MDELKPCPFCGEKPCTLDANGKVCWCGNVSCLMYEISFLIESWNTRIDACRLASVVSEEDIHKIVERYCCNAVTQYTITNVDGKPEECTFDSGCHIKTRKLARAIAEYINGGEHHPKGEK